MKTKSRNVTIIRGSDGRELLLSYSTPVAAFIPGRGYIATDRKYSVTTSRHVNDYTERRATVVPESEFRALIAEVSFS